MPIDDKHSQLVEMMKNNEKKAQNGENFFLVELITTATQDASPKYNLKEIYEALMHSRAWILLDPLNLLPLLVSCDKSSAPDMIQLISLEGNAKESMIAVQEALELLKGSLTTESDDNKASRFSRALEFVRLIGICENALPRLKLRKKDPLETIQPLVQHLCEVADLMATQSPRDAGRNTIWSMSRLIKAIIPWLSQNADIMTYKAGVDVLARLLYSTLSACASHIDADLAQRQFQSLNPKLVIRSAIRPESERGMEVVTEAIDASQSLGITSESLITPTVTFGQLILLAHGFHTFYPRTSSYLSKLSPTIITSIKKNVAMDESLALLLVFLSSSTDTLSEEAVNDFVPLLTPLASSHPHAPTRHLVFRILALVLSHAPPLIHMAHLSSLLADCPFPQMRVASVGLVKEAFLSAIDTNEKSPLTSPSLIRAFGPTIFRPDPPDLFSRPTEDSLKSFIQSSEPSRLTECLAFYYVLLKRDIKNSTGIKDRDTLQNVESGLLTPLRKALATWLGDTLSIEDVHALMPLASLETSLERVDGAISSLRNAAIQGAG